MWGSKKKSIIGREWECGSYTSSETNERYVEHKGNGMPF